MSRRNRERLKRAIEAAEAFQATPPEPAVVDAPAVPPAELEALKEAWEETYRGTPEVMPEIREESIALPSLGAGKFPTIQVPVYVLGHSAESPSDADWLALWDGRGHGEIETPCPHCGRVSSLRSPLVLNGMFLQSCHHCGVILEAVDRSSHRILRPPALPPQAPLEPTESWGLTDWRNRQAKKLSSRR